MIEEDVKEVIEPEDRLPDFEFEQLPEPFRGTAQRSGWTSPMRVQAKTIPYLLDGRDLIVQSRTGSGKTGAFLLPNLMRITKTDAYCQMLVLAPTRELAKQVHAEAVRLAEGTGIRAVAVYGGVGYGPQIEAFEKGVQIVIGTPGRILDHLTRRKLVLDRLRFLVLDEADEMLSMGFYPDMVRIRRFLPPKRQSSMFSATMPPRVRALANEFLRKPHFLSLSHGHVHVEETDHIYYSVPSMGKERALARILELENPDSAIIFCNTKDKVRFVSEVLARFGFDSDQITADLTQVQREKVMKRVKQKQLRFLVATDVAARGIDITHLSHVILFDQPQDFESYIHRSGRTGRAGAGGIAISLVTVSQEEELKKMARHYKINMEVRQLPDEEAVQRLVAERLTVLLEDKRRDLGGVERERIERFVPLAKSLTESEDELDLIAMLLEESYRASIHAAPEQPEPAPSSEEPSEEPASGPKRRPRRSGGGRSRKR
ncbi:MAG: DEAD/DEAH box helicase [Verrucomicrobia bacterium]|nr:DEAD/DEAH box helicase [Verrucomicrobiota bacterium]